MFILFITILIVAKSKILNILCIQLSPVKVKNLVGEMLNKKMITKQTTKEGILVHHVMIAESVDILRETYLCILMDRYIF